MQFVEFFSRVKCIAGQCCVCELYIDITHTEWFQEMMMLCGCDVSLGLCVMCWCWRPARVSFPDHCCFLCSRKTNKDNQTVIYILLFKTTLSNCGSSSLSQTVAVCKWKSFHTPVCMHTVFVLFCMFVNVIDVTALTWNHVKGLKTVRILSAVMISHAETVGTVRTRLKHYFCF